MFFYAIGGLKLRPHLRGLDTDAFDTAVMDLLSCTTLGSEEMCVKLVKRCECSAYSACGNGIATRRHLRGRVGLAELHVIRALLERISGGVFEVRKRWEASKVKLYIACT